MSNRPESTDMPVCPFLGLADDQESHATYATDAHRCYKLERPTKVAPNHQESFCLSESYERCPVYRGEGIPQPARPVAPGAAAAAPGAAAQPEPPPAREPASRAAGQRGGRRPAPAGGQQRPGRATPRRAPSGGGGISMPIATIALFVLAVAVIAVAIFVLNRGDDGGDGLSVADQFATEQAGGSNGDDPTQTPDNGGGDETTTEVANGTETPSAGDETATPSDGETPSGGDGDTYTVQAGDSCFAIATQFGITVEELAAANDLQPDPCTIFPDDVLTIPEPAT